jgi:hypothetical protein
VTLDDETLDRWDYALGTARVEGDDDDLDEDLETILRREAIKEGTSNVSIYTPPTMQASDLARDLQEQKTDEMVPRRLFEADHREDRLAIGESAHDVNGDLADVEPTNVKSVSPSGLEMITQMVLPNSSGEAMMANVTNGEPMAEQGGEQLPPTNLTLIDSGTTKHMLGDDGIKSIYGDISVDI